MIGVHEIMAIPAVVANLKQKICSTVMLPCLGVLNTRHLGSHLPEAGI